MGMVPLSLLAASQGTLGFGAQISTDFIFHRDMHYKEADILRFLSGKYHIREWSSFTAGRGGKGGHKI